MAAIAIVLDRRLVGGRRLERQLPRAQGFVDALMTSCFGTSDMTVMGVLLCVAVGVEGAGRSINVVG